MSLDNSIFNIFTAPTVFTNNTTKVSEATHQINFFFFCFSMSTFRLHLFLAFVT